MSKATSLLCVGNLTIDELVIGGRSTTAMGGDALFAALAARRHLTDVRMLAPLGSDVAPAVREVIADAGIRLEAAPTRGIPTVRNRVTYADDGSRHWELLCGHEAFDELSVFPDDVSPDALTAGAILVCGMGLDSQLSLGPWLRQATDAPIYLDLQEEYLAGHEAELRRLVATCDIFLPSQAEAAALAETEDPAAAARAFLTDPPSVVVVKMADRGCLVATPDGIEAFGVEPVRPVDPTGAGDAFCGAFAAVHCATGDIAAAVQAGALAARDAIGDYGPWGLLRALGLDPVQAGASCTFAS